MIETILATTAVLLFVNWRSACNASTPVFDEIRVEPACPTRKLLMPEDAVLRRHYISQLTREIEANLPPRPMDSVLRRHHQALVSATLQQRLAYQHKHHHG